MAVDLFDENLINDSRIGGYWLDMEKVLAKPNTICDESLSIYYDGKMCGVVVLQLEYKDNDLSVQLNLKSESSG